MLKTAFALSTDSGAEGYIAQRVIDKIFVIPFTYTYKDSPKRHADYFNADDEYTRFYETLDSLDIVAAPTAAEYEAYFDEIFETGATSILHIAASSGLYSSYHNAKKAAKNTLVKFRRHAIYIVDSLSVSAGQRILVDTAKALRDNGAAAAQVFRPLQTLAESIATLILPGGTAPFSARSKFDVLRHGGVLNVLPLLALDDAGKPVLAKQCRGQKAAVHFICKRYETLCRTDVSKSVYLSASDFPAAIALNAALSGNGADNASDIFWIGPPLAGLIGKNTLCAAFYATDKAKLLSQNT